MNTMNSTYTKTIVGVFDSYASAERAAQELMESGFSRDDVQITSNDTFASDAARGNTGLTGTSPAGHSVGGGMSGFFRKLFGAGEDDDKTYADVIRRGGAVVCVHTDDNRIDTARDIIERYDPIDIDKSDRGYRQNAYTGGDRSDTDRALPVAEEEIQVGKRTVERGGVRVYNRLVEEPVEEEVTLREERVHVERRPTDRPATEADFRPKDEVIEVTETVEEPVVSKRARVKEEVVIGKESNTRTEKIRDTVRRTDVDVENLGEEKLSHDFDSDFRHDFATRYSSSGASYDTYASAYRYGYTTASDPRYRGRKWEDVQDTIKTDYMRNNPGSTWEQMKGAVRYGWEKVTRKRE